MAQMFDCPVGASVRYLQACPRHGRCSCGGAGIGGQEACQDRTLRVRDGRVVPSSATSALVLRHISGRTAAASVSMSPAQDRAQGDEKLMNETREGLSVSVPH